MPSFSSQQQCLLIVGFLTAVITVTVIVIIADSVHTIEEGNVGIYYVQVNANLSKKFKFNYQYVTQGRSFSYPKVERN